MWSHEFSPVRTAVANAKSSGVTVEVVLQLLDVYIRCRAIVVIHVVVGIV